MRFVQIVFLPLLIANKLLVGEEEIKAKAEKLIQKLGVKGKELIVRGREFQPKTQTLPVIAYFYEPGYKECDRVEYMLKHIEGKFPTREIRRFNIADMKNKELFEDISEKYGVPENLRPLTPAIFLGDTFFIKTIRDKDVYRVLSTHRLWSTPWEGIEEEKKPIIERFEKFTPVGVIGAGLLDGINPCVFATIIFFISYLTFVAYKRREILVVGCFFTLAVFIAYISIGLGLFKFIRTLKALPIISMVVYYGIGGLAIVLGV